MEKCHYNEIMSFNNRESKINLEISLIQEAIGKMKTQVLSLFQGNSKQLEGKDKTLMMKFRTKSKQLKSLLNERKLMQESHRLKTRLFEEWKIDTKARLLENQDERLSVDQTIKVDLDSIMLQDFLKQNLYKIPDNATKREFEDMIGYFMEKTARREYSIQQSSGGLFSLNK